MQEKFKDVLDGKIKVDDLTSEELPEFTKFAKAEADKTRGEVAGFREAKRAEADKVAKLKDEVDKAEKLISEAKVAKESLDASKGQITQFRQEQIEKAKQKFYSSFTVSDEDKAKVEENFKRLDSGKVDADLIFKDFVSSYAASNPEGYIEAKKKLADMEKGAYNANAQGAGNHQSSPGGGDPKKFDESTVKIAQQAGITPEAADKVLKEGLQRKLG